MKKINRNFGKNLKRERGNSNLTQTELGHRLDPPMSSNEISRFENGDNPGFNRLVQFKEALKCEFDDLIDGPVDNKEETE